MNAPQNVREVVERVTREVLSRNSDALLREITARVCGEVQAQHSAAELAHATAAIRAQSGQAEVLAAVLDAAADFCSRCGILVVRGNTATAWQARNLPEEAFRGCALNCATGPAAQVCTTRKSVTATASTLDPALTVLATRLETPAALIPLVIRERVPVLLYVADDSALDLAALELIALEAGLWLELLALRRSSGDATAQPVSAQALSPAPVAQPQQTAVPSAPVDSPPQPYSPPTSYSYAPEPVALNDAPSDPFAQGFASSPAAPIPPPAPRGPVESEVHEKARRFAKLLVEEIKLYNQAQVQQGRQSRDLYDRLRADIEKSRAAYAKRYGSVIHDKDYFAQELIRILADNDRSLLGANFPG